MAVSVNDLDKKTVSMLDKGIAHLAAKLDPKYKTSDGKPLSEKTKRKVLALKNKYVMQKGKTVNLFNKHKKKPGLKGLSVNTMSVEKIYQAIGKETKDNAFAAWFRESPGRVFNIAGGGLALGGAITAMASSEGAGVFGAIAEWFGGLTAGQQWAVSLLGAGAVLLIAGHTMNAIQKNKFKNAAIKNDAENAMNSGSVHDNEAVRTADAAKISSLAQEAAVDPNIMQHLQDVIKNPRTPDDVAKKATTILAEAEKLQQANRDRVQGAKLKEAIESSAKGAEHATTGHLWWKEGVSYAKELKNFAIHQEVTELLEQQNAAIVALDDPSLSAIGIDPTGGAGSDKDKYDQFIAFVQGIKKDDFDKVPAEADFTAMIKNHATFTALPTGNAKLTAHIESIIKTRFNNFASMQKISALNDKGVIAAALSGGKYVSTAINIDGKIMTEIEQEGMEAILDLAEKIGIKGFEAPPPVDVDKTHASYPTKKAARDAGVIAAYNKLCAKFGGPKGVKEAIKSVQQGELNLEGMEK